MGRQPCLAAALTILLAAALLVPVAVQAYEFDMIFQTKCIMEDLTRNEEVHGQFWAFNKDHPDQPVHIDTRFEDPNGHLAFEDHGLSHTEFRFTTTDEGEYKFCFTAKDYHTAQNTRISFKMAMGAAAHDWAAVAKKDHLTAIQTELMKLESMTTSIHLELQSIRRKEEQMRNINEATNARVAWFNISAAIICLLLCGWQLWYLNKFFKRKKVL